MPEDSFQVRWAGRRALVVLPEHLGLPNAGQASEALLSIINRGADALVVDMTATVSCDYTGADALLRARQRAVASGTELRLAVTSRIVRRALSLSGLDHLISIYPSLEAAMAAAVPAPAATAVPGPPDWLDSPVITRAVLRGLLDVLDDGVALADGDGALVLASRRLEEMFGYGHEELAGRRIDSLIPASPGEAPGHGTAFAQAAVPPPRPAGTGARLAGARKDGVSFPVEVRRIPVQTPAGQFTLTVVRDVARARPERPARPSAAGEQVRRGPLITSLSRAGLRLRPVMESSRDAAWPRIAEALRYVNDGIRGASLAAPRQRTAPRGASPGGYPGSEPVTGRHR
jgi:anti-anti-sigma factor